MARQEPRCSFCGRSRDTVRRLVAGPGVFICDGCIEVCVEIVDGRGSGPAPFRQSPLRRLACRLSEVFARRSSGSASASG